MENFSGEVETDVREHEAPHLSFLELAPRQSFLSAPFVTYLEISES